MKSKDICKHKLCTGCEACANICPHQAINMRPDWRGFKYPTIDNKLCINCNLCKKICPVNKSKEKFRFEKAYAFVEHNKNFLYKASSGGAFGVIARYVIQEKGIVFGATMNNNYDIYYKGVETIEDLDLLYGSKYVQSYINNTYKQIKEKLKKGRKVLFCGCPCQVAGLNEFLHIKYENLITMDLICHGVPSQPYFKDYVQDILKKNKNKGIKFFRFRWKPETAIPSPETIYIGYRNKDYYMSYFLWGKGFRPGCYHCKFAGEIRQGDFTIGDFWNTNLPKLSIDETHGASLILTNTSKAEELKHLFKENGEFILIRTLHEAISKDGGQLMHPSKYDIRCNLIYITYKLFGVKGPAFLYKLNSIRF